MAKKKRTSIRTAAGTTQEAFLARIKELRQDPRRVLPLCPDGDPPAVAKMRKAVERIATKGPHFLDRRDKGIVGGIANAWPLAEATAVPRLLDARVAGRRRFFLQRGHVDRTVSLGIQNHDDPRALLLAYRAFAKKNDVHFFATPELWCLKSPNPPAAWWSALGDALGCDLREEEPGVWGDGRKGARVELAFRGGPLLRVGKPKAHAHQTISSYYAGPRQRQPVEVTVRLPDGATHTPSRDDVASYRAQVLDESGLIAKSLAAWRAGDTTRFVIGETVYEDQGAFLDDLAPAPWERSALQAMTRGGHQGDTATVAAVLEAHKGRMLEGVGALVSDPAQFIDAHPVQPKELLRLAHEEAERRATLAAMPAVDAGPIGRFVDDAERHRRAHGDALTPARHALDAGVPAHHVAAWLVATGDMGDLAARLDADAKEAGEALAPHMKPLIGAEGSAYVDAVRAYLRESGSGEA